MKCQRFFIITLAFLMIWPAIALAHIPYVPPYDTNCFLSYLVTPPDAPLGKSITIYEHFHNTSDVDVFIFWLIEDDFDPSLTMLGFTEEDAVPDGLPENWEVPLVYTDAHGVTGRKLFARTVLPACPTYDNVLPNMAIVGPRQSYLPEDTGEVALPFTLDEGQGIHVVTNQVQGDPWYEKFTFKSYVNQNSAELLLTEPGFYTIYIWEPNGHLGDYLLELGHVEVMGFAEIMRSLSLIFWQVNDGEIKNEQCKIELEELDGPNPSAIDVLEFFYEIFGK